MSIRNIHISLVYFNIGLIFAVGLMTLASLLNPFEFAAQAAHSEVNHSRKPASLTKESAETPLVFHEDILKTIHLGCHTNQSKYVQIAPETRQVRITGSHCTFNKETFQKTIINNKSNDFIATVFELPNLQYTSDYIQLSLGKNLIEIQEVSMDGTLKISQLTLATESL